MAQYPNAYEFDAVLRDGEVVRVRPIRPGDGSGLARFFEMLGPQSRYFRFFRLKQELTPEELEYFTTVDYDSRMAFVAIDEGRIVGVGRYDRTEEEPQVAEVAFAVADAHQNRGIGTQLLQLLTAYGRAHSIEGFRAYVLADNSQMMRVFRNSGYELSRTFEEGIYRVSFPVAPSDDARRAAEEREKRAVAASILPIFYPRSVAVIGASRRPESIGARLFRNLIGSNFTGPLYPVNPSTNVVNSVRAYSSVLDVPDDVDLAFIVVPAAHVLDAVRQCAEKGVRGVVVISAGFSEVGEAGKARERELLDIVRSAGMRMVGPNCMGVLNTDPVTRLNGTFAPVFPPPGNVAMSSQSGALGIAILDYAQRAGIGISTFVSVGNKADISGNDLLLAWEDDPATDVIVLYLESFGNPRRFGRIARRIARRKPIVAVKSGRTAAGTRAASSHTGALASLDVAVDALFNLAGVIRTDTLEELFAVTGLLANQPIPTGRRVGVVTNAGGPGILAADALESSGLELPEFSTELQAILRRELPEEAATRNPVDLIASAGPKEYLHCLSAMLESDEIDSVIAVYIPTTPTGSDEIAAAICEAEHLHGSDTTLLTVFMQSGEGSQLLADERVRIPAYAFPEAAALALARAARYGEWRAQTEGTIPRFDDLEVSRARRVVASAADRLGAEGGWLEPHETAEVLQAYGISQAATVMVTSPEQAVSAAAEMGGPVALKVVAPSALHKSDVGGLLLDVEGAEAVRAAYERVTGVVDDAEGAIVQEMVYGGHEVLIGMTEDPSFGPLIVFGLGGVFVELLGDVSFRIHPLTDREARAMTREIKTAPLLRGFRGMDEGDLDGVVDTLLRVSALVEGNPELVEMDLNPVKVLAPGHGVRVVDARLRIQPLEPGWSPELIDLPSVTGTTRPAHEG